MITSIQRGNGAEAWRKIASCNFESHINESISYTFRMKMMDLVEGYKEILTKSANFEIQSFDLKIAERTALIRAIYGFRTPGAIQIATAIEYGADFFLTNDTKLKKLKDINIIMVKEL